MTQSQRNRVDYTIYITTGMFIVGLIFWSGYLYGKIHENESKINNHTLLLSKATTKDDFKELKNDIFKYLDISKKKDDEEVKIPKPKLITVRKDHKCSLCGESIHRGEKAYYSGVYCPLYKDVPEEDQEHWRGRVHVDCLFNE